MSASDGSIVGITKIVNAGSTAAKWNLVLVAEGYDARDLGAKFPGDAMSFASTLLATPPFPGLKPAINVFRLDVSSTDNGADDPAACPGGTGAVKATFFDASFCNSGLRRYLKVDANRVVDAVEAALPEFDAIAVMVNSKIYGGSGSGQVAVFSMDPAAFEIGLHELGHSAFGLADEYAEGLGNHSNIEPAAANITVKKKKADVKWVNHIAPGTAIPTEKGPTCGNNVVVGSGGTLIGTFEGARRFNCKVYRPSNYCKMRVLGQPFCIVCQEHIAKYLAPFMAMT